MKFLRGIRSKKLNITMEIDEGDNEKAKQNFGSINRFVCENVGKEMAIWKLRGHFKYILKEGI